MLVNEFNYNFFPCAFDVKLRVTSAHPDYIVEKVYGTAYADEMITKYGQWTHSTHKLYPEEFKDIIKTFYLCLQRNNLPELPPEILSHIINYISPPVQYVTQINTLFPSPKISDQTKGGLILLNVKKVGETSNDPVNIDVEIRYRKTVNGDEQLDHQSIIIQSSDINVYTSDGMKKAVYLHKYVELVKLCIEDEKKENIDKLREFSKDFRGEIVTNESDIQIRQVVKDMDSFIYKIAKS